VTHKRSTQTTENIANLELLETIDKKSPARPTTTHIVGTMAAQKTERTGLIVGLNKGHVRPRPSHLLEDPF
jgi:hypothetical protein